MVFDFAFGLSYNDFRLLPCNKKILSDDIENLHLYFDQFLDVTLAQSSSILIFSSIVGQRYNLFQKKKLVLHNLRCDARFFSILSHSLSIVTALFLAHPFTANTLVHIYFLVAMMQPIEDNQQQEASDENKDSKTKKRSVNPGLHLFPIKYSQAINLFYFTSSNVNTIVCQSVMITRERFENVLKA